MPAASPTVAKFRGVLCRFCGKAIRLTGSTAEKEAAFNQDESKERHNLRSRVFPLRCKRCGTEGVYVFTEVSTMVEPQAQ
jgi:ribosomal protein S27E